MARRKTELGGDYAGKPKGFKIPEAEKKALVERLRATVGYLPSEKEDAVVAVIWKLKGMGAKVSIKVGRDSES